MRCSRSIVTSSARAMNVRLCPDRRAVRNQRLAPIAASYTAANSVFIR
jgi:hypothetical protein